MKKDLNKITEKDIALLLFVRTLIDNLNSNQKDYWHMKNILNRIKLTMKEMQVGSKHLFLIYKKGHEISDIAWYNSRKEKSLMISAVALIVTFIDQNSDRFNLMIGPTYDQIKGIANKYYNEEELQSVKLNSWKAMKRLTSHLNKVIYDSEQDSEYLIKNKVIPFLTL